MRFGLTPEEIQLIESLIVKPLMQQGAQVWIFGSRARGDHKRFSDVDLLFQLPSNYTLPSGFLSLLQERIEDSRLPYKVDLVDWEELADTYRAGALQDRIPLDHP